MASKRYTFPDNKLPYGWTATRVSLGGQNDGSWRRDIKDGKIYYVGLNAGTESNYWGEWLSIPVNAVGNIIVDATIRQKRNANTLGGIGVGINQLAAASGIRNGCELNFLGAARNYIRGMIAGVNTAWPGRPAQTIQALGDDELINLRVVRIAGASSYVFLYIDNKYVGQGALAGTITSVDVLTTWGTGQLASEKWLQLLSITPSSVVL